MNVGDKVELIESRSYTGIIEELFYEFEYIINLTTNKFEFYVGGQTKPTTKHRYYTSTPMIIPKSENSFYNCELVKEYPLNKISKNWYKNYDN